VPWSATLKMGLLSSFGDGEAVCADRARIRAK
jgi:hypothetical protein